MSFVTIVASLHGGTGKTLLARVLADYFILSGEQPVLFDTDVVERRLSACFPDKAIVIDLAQVRGQMALFDNLAAPAPATRVADVTHVVFRKFFDLMRDTDFVAEAKAIDVEPVIFYVPDHRADSFEAGRDLIDRFEDCAVVIVDNAQLRRPGEATRRAGAFRALDTHPLRLRMPALDPALLEALEDPDFSLGDLVRQPLPARDAAEPGSDLPLAARAAVRAWLVKLLQEIFRVTEALKARDTRQALLVAPHS